MSTTTNHHHALIDKKKSRDHIWFILNNMVSYIGSSPLGGGRRGSRALFLFCGERGGTLFHPSFLKGWWIRPKRLV